MKKKLLSLTLVVAMLTMLLCACGPKTLETYYSKAAVKSQIDDGIQGMLDSLSDTYSAAGWYVSGNTFTYTYTFVDDMAPYFDSATTESNLAGQADDLIASVKKEAGLSDDTVVTVEWIYYNNDGSVLGDFSFEK